MGSTYSVIGGGINQCCNNYGSPTTFSGIPISGGNITIAITDGDDAGCTLTNVIVTAPSTCSDGCNINDAGLSNIICNNNNSPSDPSDDTFSFTLNPTGSNLGSTYSVIGGGINQCCNNYGSPTTFSGIPISGGNITIAITDSDDAGCTLTNILVTAPSTCSDGCNINDAGLANIICNNNNTPSDPSDDTFSFTLNPTGSNLGSTYSVIGGGINQCCNNYGSPTTFSGIPISGGNIAIAITDSDDAGCTLTNVVVTAPSTCSDGCNINDAGLANIICNNNNTPSDPSDDTYSFTLNPTGVIWGVLIR